MTLVFEERRSGPGTHALIIGVGRYPAVPDMGLLSPERSALALTDWLTKSFRNPAAPLASIDLLASTPGDAPIGYAPPTFMGLPSLIAIERPDFDAVRKAAMGWQDRLAMDEDNIGLFFFTGHGGLSDADTVMLLEDFTVETGDNVVSMQGLLGGMQEVRARQLYLIDVSREPLARNFSGRPLLSPTPLRSTPLARAILHAAPPGGMAFASADGPSVFTQALLAALDKAPPDPGSGALTPGRIAEYADRWLAAIDDGQYASQRITWEISRDFDFHFPTLVTKVGPAPKPAEPDGDPAAAADEDTGEAFPAEPAEKNAAFGTPVSGSAPIDLIDPDDVAEADFDTLDTAAIEQAAASYRAALERTSRDEQPLQWAMVLNNLGNALRTLGERRGERGELDREQAALEEAVALYRGALEVYSRDERPLEWAMVLNNLGNALQALGERRGEPGVLEEAVELYRRTLEVYSRDERPLEWAMVLNNLGDAFRALGERLEEPAALQEAALAYRAALEVYRPELQPLEWATAQSNLDDTLRALGEPHEEPAALEAALMAFREKLKAHPRDEQTADWAAMLTNLDIALGALRGRRLRTNEPDRAAAPSPRQAGAETAGTGDEALTDFVPDDAEEDRDELGRAGLAIALAHKLHQVWRRANDPPPPGADSRAAFVVHLDAPWGGGKTTFANFLGRVLNPLPNGARRPAQFLAQRFPGRDPGPAFLEDPPADRPAEERLAKVGVDARRPWIVIGFNAWQSEHIAPPWWVFYQAIRKGCFDAIRREGHAPWRPSRPNFAARPAYAARVEPWPVERWVETLRGAWRIAAEPVRRLFERPPPPPDSAAPDPGAPDPEPAAPDPAAPDPVAPALDPATAPPADGPARVSPLAQWRRRLRQSQRRLARRGRRLGRVRTAAARNARWAVLWLREFIWRLTNPKVRSLLLTALFSGTLLGLLIWFELFGTTPPRTGLGAGAAPGVPAGTGFLLTSGLGVLLAGLTGATAIWGLGALFTESIVPGTDTLAERLSLGSGDPFARFRAHFAHTIARVRRPVMVMVDDLDRCRPDFVVDLIRGIQTLLRSSRVVFVILGDRDWIERAFEAHHDAMKAVDVGPEQSFGARFVEKAIQMSFILPALGPDRQRAYLRRVLLGDRAAVRTAVPAMTAADTARMNEAVDRELAKATIDSFESKELVDRVHSAVQAPAEGETAAAVPRPAVPREEVAQRVNERLASRIVTSTDFETEVIHQLEPLAPYFPANPRQIKRIVNAITLYYAVAIALQRKDLVPNRAFRDQLALWVIIMTEWPKTWRLLASFPELVDLLCEAAPKEAVAQAKALPGSPEATLTALEPILADRNLMSLITGYAADGKFSHKRLETGHVRTLADLTPLHSRKRRLDESADARAVAGAWAGFAPRVTWLFPTPSPASKGV